MQIFWTKKSQIQTKTSDPLGFNFRIKLTLFDSLFLGLTNPVTRAKYYILYPRFIQSLEKSNDLNISSFLKLEKAYLIATYEHSKEENDKDHSGILGINSISGKSYDELKDFNFEIFKNSQSGYNRLRGNLITIGLICQGNNENNEINDKLTSLGKQLIDNILINSNLNHEILIKEFKKNECLCDLSSREKFLLKKVFLGDYSVKKQKDGTYDVYFDDSVKKTFDYKILLKNVDDRERISIYSKIRYNSLKLILYIFNKNPTDFLDELIKNCFSDNNYLKNIRQIWRFYFLVCGFQEICQLTLFLIYEILKNKWNRTEDQEVSLNFEELQIFLKEKLIYESETKIDDFFQIAKEVEKIVNDMAKDKENSIKKIPFLIKEYYRILFDNFKREPDDLIQFLTALDSSATENTLKEFLRIYELNKNFEKHSFVYLFLKDFCLPRQNSINLYRNYKGKERVLLYQTEKEIISKFSKTDEGFNPLSVFEQFKLTNNLKKIITDLGLISDNKLTKDGKKVLETYD